MGIAVMKRLPAHLRKRRDFPLNKSGLKIDSIILKRRI